MVHFLGYKGRVNSNIEFKVSLRKDVDYMEAGPSYRHKQNRKNNIIIYSKYKREVCLTERVSKR